MTDECSWVCAERLQAAQDEYGLAVYGLWLPCPHGRKWCYVNDNVGWLPDKPTFAERLRSETKKPHLKGVTVNGGWIDEVQGW